MKSLTTARFWELHTHLPPNIQRKANKAYRVWKTNPFNKGLFFKRVNDEYPLYSVRIGRDYRALGVLEGDTVTWSWIGSHDDYIRFLAGR